jgi:hypothetical protein
MTCSTVNTSTFLEIISDYKRRSYQCQGGTGIVNDMDECITRQQTRQFCALNHEVLTLKKLLFVAKVAVHF